MKVISTFSGAGGFDLGFIKAGHNVIWANDIDSDCVETYKKNIGSHITNKSIREINTSDIPDGEIVIGGFPCQGFSCANMKRNKNDERNELYLEFLRVIKGKRPLYFVAENVRGLLSLEGGEIIRIIISDFEKAGYRVKYRLFDVANYGVPQNRKRVIILGTRKDLPLDLEPDFPEPTYCNGGKLLNAWITIEKALSGIPEPNGNHRLLNHICSQYKVTNRNFTGHRTTNPNKPSPTILARGNGKGGVCAIQHPANHRRLSVRESAIVQTFPLDFVFYGSMNSMYRQVGNAVPVDFAKILGMQFKKLESKIEVSAR